MVGKGDIARTHEERVMVLRSISNDALLAEIEDRSIKQDVQWLTSMLEIGLFDLDGARLDAFFKFLRSTVMMEVREDPVYGELPIPGYCMTFVASTDFDQFYDRFIDRIVTRRTSAGRQPDPVRDAPRERELNDSAAISKAIVGCIALDKPAQLQRLLSMTPDDCRITVNGAILGFALSDFVTGYSGFNFTPFFYALQFSRSEMLGMTFTRGSGGSPGLIARAVGGDLSLSLVEAIGKGIAPTCLPSVYEKALRHFGIDLEAPEFERLRASLGDVVCGAQRFAGYQPYLIAFLKAGVLDQLASEVAHAACISGMPWIIRGLVASIDWDAIPMRGDEKDDPLAVVAVQHSRLGSKGRQAGRARYEEALIALYDRAVLDGRYDLVTCSVQRVNPGGIGHSLGPVISQPITSILEAGFSRVLIMMLELGLNPDEPRHLGARSPIEVAELLEEAAAPAHGLAVDGIPQSALMRAFRARMQARTLLEGAHRASQVSGATSNAAARAAV